MGKFIQRIRRLTKRNELVLKKKGMGKRKKSGKCVKRQQESIDKDVRKIMPEIRAKIIVKAKKGYNSALVKVDRCFSDEYKPLLLKLRKKLEKEGFSVDLYTRSGSYWNGDFSEPLIHQMIRISW
ncbi:MAG: hypothetical protein PHC97_04030 [Patescibacteria group bacterium]|nr:hypothetical protein [Patescibacteria group bacterium]